MLLKRNILSAVTLVLTLFYITVYCTVTTNAESTQSHSQNLKTTAETNSSIVYEAWMAEAELGLGVRPVVRGEPSTRIVEHQAPMTRGAGVEPVAARMPNPAVKQKQSFSRAGVGDLIAMQQLAVPEKAMSKEQKPTPIIFSEELPAKEDSNGAPVQRPVISTGEPTATAAVTSCGKVYKGLEYSEDEKDGSILYQSIPIEVAPAKISKTSEHVAGKVKGTNLNFAGKSRIDHDMRELNLNTVEEIELGLSGRLSGKAEFLLEMQEMYNVSVASCVAVARTETTSGEYGNGTQRKNNLFNIRAGNGEYIKYDSIEEGIEAFFSLISECYMQPDHYYHKGYTVGSVGPVYAEGPEWSQTVNTYIDEFLEAVPNNSEEAIAAIKALQEEANAPAKKKINWK